MCPGLLSPGPCRYPLPRQTPALLPSASHGTCAATLQAPWIIGGLAVLGAGVYAAQERGLVDLKGTGLPVPVSMPGLLSCILLLLVEGARCRLRVAASHVTLLCVTLLSSPARQHGRHLVLPACGAMQLDRCACMQPQGRSTLTAKTWQTRRIHHMGMSQRSPLTCCSTLQLSHSRHAVILTCTPGACA